MPDGHHYLFVKFLGLIALEDPLRPTVPAAVSQCQTAGIRVVMITGDYPATVQSIARQAGLASHEMRNLFHFASIHTGDMVLRLSAGLICVIV